MREVAFLRLDGALDQLAEQRYLVLVRIRHPLAVLLAVVVGGDANLRHLVMLGDLADPADDPKLRDVLHGPVPSIDQAHS